jgi:uncharacterized protein (TIGR01777 family)
MGRELEKHYLNRGSKVYILTRSPKKENHLYWDAKNMGKWAETINHSDILINLTGKSVDCRYNQTNKAEILASRVQSTQVLQRAVAKCSHPPKIWINSSTATIYADSRTHQNTEANGIIGNDFSMNVAQQWEKAFFQSPTPSTRKVAVRTSLVIGKSGGVYPVLQRLARFGLGGSAGDGQQKFACITIEDFIRAIDFIIDHEAVTGVVNCTSPEDLTNSDFMALLRKKNNTRFYINQPEWMIRLGAILIGTAPELILKSRYVYPEKLLKAGFQFKHQIL